MRLAGESHSWSDGVGKGGKLTSVCALGARRRWKLCDAVATTWKRESFRD